jgi:tRNA(fMet)-specific endonuclease VapC
MNGTAYLLDTNVILNLVRSKELGKYILATYSLETAVHRPLISIVTVGEIWAIADRRQWGSEKRGFLQKMLETLVILDLDNEAILNGYVEMDRVSRGAAKGARNLSDNDLWIAATAKAAGAVLLTSDKDFLHFHPDHCLVQYIDPRSGRSAGAAPEGWGQ